MNHPLHLHPHLAAQRRFRRSPAGSRPGGFLCFPGKHPCDRPSVYPKPFQHPVAAGTKPTPRTNAASSVTFYADAQSLSPNYLSSVVRAHSHPMDRDHHHHPCTALPGFHQTQHQGSGRKAELSRPVHFRTLFQKARRDVAEGIQEKDLCVKKFQQWSADLEG